MHRRGGSRWEREGTPPRHFLCTDHASAKLGGGLAARQFGKSETPPLIFHSRQTEISSFSPQKYLTALLGQITLRLSGRTLPRKQYFPGF